MKKRLLSAILTMVFCVSSSAAADFGTLTISSDREVIDDSVLYELAEADEPSTLTLRTAAQVHLVAAFHSLKHFPSCVKFSYCLYYLSEYRWCQWVIVFQGYSWYSEAITEWQIGI